MTIIRHIETHGIYCYQNYCCSRQNVYVHDLTRTYAELVVYDNLVYVA